MDNDRGQRREGQQQFTFQALANGLQSAPWDGLPSGALRSAGDLMTGTTKLAGDALLAGGKVLVSGAGTALEIAGDCADAAGEVLGAVIEGIAGAAN